MSRGEEPYQSFALLFKLRDAIAHLKPHGYTIKEGEVIAIAQSGLLNELHSRKLIDDPRPVDFLGNLAGPVLARWAVDTALRVIKHVVEILPRGDLKWFCTVMIHEELGLELEDLHELWDTPNSPEES